MPFPSPGRRTDAEQARRALLFLALSVAVVLRIPQEAKTMPLSPVMPQAVGSHIQPQERWSLLSWAKEPSCKAFSQVLGEGAHHRCFVRLEQADRWCRVVKLSWAGTPTQGQGGGGCCPPLWGAPPGWLGKGPQALGSRHLCRQAQEAMCAGSAGLRMQSG